MRTIISIFIFILPLISCNFRNINRTKSCICCEKSFVNIDSAMNCIYQHKVLKNNIDSRLLLFAFVNKNIEKYQDMGWNIIKDPDIVNIAKRDYLLIIINPNQIKNSETQSTSVFLDKIKQHKEDELYYVIANQALYPFADWTPDEKKNTIIDKLRVGDGP